MRDAVHTLAWLLFVGVGGVAAERDPPLPFQILVQNPSYVWYPNDSLPFFPDQSTLFLNFSKTVQGYNGFSATFKFVDGPLITSYLPALERVTTWDMEGAVVLSEPPATPQAVGAVHNEHGWYYKGNYHYYGYITYVGYNASTGLWQPNSENANDTLIITSPGPQGIGGPTITGTGPHWMVRNGAYLLVYAEDAFAVDAVTGAYVPAFTVSRSLVTDGGLPGTWFKYYNGAWEQPGIGGNGTALANLVGAKMVWLDSYNVWVAVSYTGTMSYSYDGLKWGLLPSQLFPQTPVDQPLSYYQYPDRYYYTSFVTGWGINTYYSADSLWLYYCYIPAGNASWAAATRGLASVQLVLAPPPNATSFPFALLVFTNYLYSPPPQHALVSSPHNNEGTKVGGTVVDWRATSLPPVDLSYAYGWRLGLIFAAANDWSAAPLIPILDCFIVETHDHFVGLPGECEPQANSTLTYAFLGSIGYILSSNETAVPPYQLMPLWRCFDAANQNHYVNPEVGCKPTDEDPTLLGYMMWQAD